MGYVGELGSSQPDFSTSLDASRPWLNIGDFRPFVEAEGEASFDKINSVEGYCNGDRCREVRCGWSSAENSCSLDKLGLDNCVSNLTEWENAILWHLLEPSSGD